VREAVDTAAGLVINGDLFDLWYSYRHFVPRPHARTLTVLADAVAAGLRVVFVGGNRDAAEWDAGALADDIGLEVYPGPVRLQLGERSALIAHGDGVRLDRAGRLRSGAFGGYRPRYPLLRHPVLVWTARYLLPADAVAGLMARFSRTRIWVARHARGESTGPKRAAPRVERWARQMLEADTSLDLVLAGHSHVPAFREVGSGRFYINSGDWVSHYTYVVLPSSPGRPEVRVWPSRALVDWSNLDDGESRPRQSDLSAPSSQDAVRIAPRTHEPIR
jgi:UDP-2,3-diacylglucosamine hydrolase